MDSGNDAMQDELDEVLRIFYQAQPSKVLSSQRHSTQHQALKTLENSSLNLKDHSVRQRPMDRGVEALKQGVASLYESERRSDLTIICGPYHFKVHRTILEIYTQYFQKIDSFKEGETSTITLKSIDEAEDNDDEAHECDDPDAIKCMIYFMYHLEYNLVGKPITAESGEDHMALHAMVFATAVKYQIPALRYLAVMKFAAEVRLHWNKPAFANAVYIAHTTTPEDIRELRDITTKVITIRPQLFNVPELKSAVMEIDGLAWELLRTSKGFTAAMPNENYLNKSCFHCGTEKTLQGCGCARICANCRSKTCPFCSI